MKHLESVRDILADVYKNDCKEAEKFELMGAGFEKLTAYNQGRAAATKLAIQLIEQQIGFMKDDKS